MKNENQFRFLLIINTKKIFFSLINIIRFLCNLFIIVIKHILFSCMLPKDKYKKKKFVVEVV